MLPKFNIIQLLKNRLEGIPLRLQLWDGKKIDLASNPKVTLTLVQPTALRHFFYPSLSAVGSAAGNAYIEGEIRIDGSISDILNVLNAVATTISPESPSVVNWMINKTIGQTLRKTLRKTQSRSISWLHDLNPLENRDNGSKTVSKKASNDFYQLWLDRNQVYSCAYFKTGNEDLDTAQEQNLEYLCRKLMLTSGDTLLDMNCGWGALMRWAAENYEVKITGIALNRNQFQYTSDLIKKNKLEKRCKVILCEDRQIEKHIQREARDVREVFDKIVNIGTFEVGMFEKVGIQFLRKGGLLLNQGFLFGDLQPEKHSERYKEIEIADIENLRPHQTKTLLHWATRLEQNQQEARALIGDRHYRIWKTYLIGSALAFERGWMSVLQTVAFKKTETGTWPLPWTREHLYVQRNATEKVKLVA